MIKKNLKKNSKISSSIDIILRGTYLDESNPIFTTDTYDKVLEKIDKYTLQDLIESFSHLNHRSINRFLYSVLVTRAYTSLGWASII